MWQEPEVAEYIPFAPVSTSQSWARFNGNSYRWVANGFGNWAVVDKDGKFLGTTGFFRRDGAFASSSLESGWVFARSGHGRGYACEAVRLAHDWLDTKGICDRSECMMDPAHGASIRVAEKAGYQFLRVAEDEWGRVQLMERVGVAT